MVNSRDSILTKRERDVLALAGRGLTNQEIADELFISPRTVKSILHRACVRLDARNRTQAVITATRRGALHILDMFSADDLAELLTSLPPELMASVCQRVEHNHVRNRLPSVTAGYESENNDSKDRMAGGVECVC
jgi:DNA-binding CsgD family transcriptional regulator